VSADVRGHSGELAGRSRYFRPNFQTLATEHLLPPVRMAGGWYAWLPQLARDPAARATLIRHARWCLQAGPENSSRCSTSYSRAAWW
jgi:hypothetical protein